jgi:hypothetical protein
MCENVCKLYAITMAFYIRIFEHVKILVSMGVLKWISELLRDGWFYPPRKITLFFKWKTMLYFSAHFSHKVLYSYNNGGRSLKMWTICCPWPKGVCLPIKWKWDVGIELCCLHLRPWLRSLFLRSNTINFHPQREAFNLGRYARQ